MTMARDMDGREIRIGSYVSWKGDIEMSGKVDSIIPTGFGGHTVGVSYNDPHTDEPMCNDVLASKCWQE